MIFRLHIPGRDDADSADRANPANPLILDAPISGLAELATHGDARVAAKAGAISGLAGLADLGGSSSALGTVLARLPPSLSKYTQSTVMLSANVAAAVEVQRTIKRHARIVWLGYGTVADELTEIMAARDRRLDDRRLCVECAHAGAGWRCNKKQGFLTDVLQRCKFFDESA